MASSSSSSSSSSSGRATRSVARSTTPAAEGRGPGLHWRTWAPATALALLALLFNLLRPAYPVPPSNGIVVVTGTSSGIGNAVATHLANQGFHVFAGVRRRESFDAWQRAKQKNIQPLMLDVTDQDSIQAAAKEVQAFRRKHGLKLAGVVGNAGLGAHMPVEHHPLNEVKRLFDVNTFGNVALVQAFAPLIREDKARIVFTSSLAERITQPKEGIYSASKAALGCIADALRQELLPFKISVSLVEPGFVATPILAKILDTEEVGNATQAAATYPRLYKDSYFRIFEFGLHRAGSPQKVAHTIHRALADKRPKTRYTVTNFMGIPTWLAARAKWLLPDRLFDKIVA